MDVDDLMTGKPRGGSWRNLLRGDALELVEAIEDDIVETGRRPQFMMVTDRLNRLGVSVTHSTVSRHFKSFARSVDVEW